jgi:hypothetical protein
MNDTRERDRWFAKIAVVGEDVFRRGWYVAEPGGCFYLTRGGTWTFNVHDFWPTEDEAKAALESVRSKLPPSTAWHDKPTCPGLWMCVDKNDYNDLHPSLCVVDQEEFDSGIPENWLVYYGPIPPRETGEAT